MTDEAFTFKQTVAERSIQKNSAYHKKNGSAIAKLGNKPMSWKEVVVRCIDSWKFVIICGMGTFLLMFHPEIAQVIASLAH